MKQQSERKLVEPVKPEASRKLLMDEFSILLPDFRVRIRVGPNMLSPEQMAIFSDEKRDIYAAGYLRGAADSAAGHGMTRLLERLKALSK